MVNGSGPAGGRLAPAWLLGRGGREAEDSGQRDRGMKDHVGSGALQFLPLAEAAEDRHSPGSRPAGSAHIHRSVPYHDTSLGAQSERPCGMKDGSWMRFQSPGGFARDEDLKVIREAELTQECLGISLPTCGHHRQAVAAGQSLKRTVGPIHHTKVGRCTQPAPAAKVVGEGTERSIQPQNV